MLNTDTDILDEKQIAEIERDLPMTTEQVQSLCQTVRALQADVDKFSTLADERHDLLSAERRENGEIRMHRAQLSGRVEQLRQCVVDVGKENAVLQSRLAQVEQERNDLRIAVEIATEEDADVALSKLHKVQHEALRNQECDALRELRAIKADALNVLVAAERHAITDFRTRAIQLCRDKAAEWSKASDDQWDERPDLAFDAGEKVKAANEICEELEKLT